MYPSFYSFLCYHVDLRHSLVKSSPYELICNILFVYYTYILRLKFLQEYIWINTFFCKSDFLIFSYLYLVKQSMFTSFRGVSILRVSFKFLCGLWWCYHWIFQCCLMHSYHGTITVFKYLGINICSCR